MHTMIHGLNNDGDICGMVTFGAVDSSMNAWGGFAHVDDSERDESDWR
jgi:hypothetical protein